MTIGQRHRDKALQEHQQFVATLLELLSRRIALNSPCQLRAGERALFALQSAGLFEPRSGGGSWVGHSKGVSIPVGDTRMRLRVGQSKGHYVRAPEEPTVIDQGAVTVTDQRIVFQGSRRVQEWQLAKLVGFLHDDKRRMTAIQVSNRQKVSGIAYPGVDPEHVHLVLGVAAAISAGQEDDVIAELRAMLPPAPAAAVQVSPATGSNAVAQPPSSTPPIWAPDPSRRHELRYWDGQRWTEHVSGGGVEGDADPL